MKRMLTLILAFCLIVPLIGCEQKDQQKYNINNDFKNRIVNILDEIDTNASSNQTQNDVTALIKETDNNSQYTKDEQNLSMQVFNYAGQMLLVSNAKLISDNNYNTQKANADSIRQKNNQYIK